METGNILLFSHGRGSNLVKKSLVPRSLKRNVFKIQFLAECEVRKVITMTLYHFGNCLALVYVPYYLTYKYSGL